MTDAQVIEAIRRDHLQANISNPYYVRHYWERAWLDPGGTIFSDGPYVKLPVDWLLRDGSDETEEVVIRVYPPARLLRRLLRAWKPTGVKAAILEIVNKNAEVSPAGHS